MERIGEPNLVQKLGAHRGEVTCADAFGALLVTGGGDRALRLWRWGAGAGWLEEAVAKAAHRYGVTCARWSPAGALVASGGVDGALRVWAARGLPARRTLAAPDAAAVRALCWPGGMRLVAGHDDGACSVWHVPRAALLARLRAHQGALHAVAAPAAGALLLTACTEGVLKVFDLVEVCLAGPEGTPPAVLTWVDGAHDLGAMCADANDAGRLVATGGHDARIQVWRAELDADAGRWSVVSERVLEGHAATVTALRWAGGADARALLASASLDRTARLWDALAGACVHVLHAHPRYLTCISLDYHLRYMVTGSNDKTVRMWSLGALTLDDELEPACAALAHFGLGDLEGIGPVDEDELEEGCGSGETADEADENGSRRAWHERAHAGPVNCISVHGDIFATASSDGLVRVFQWTGGEAGATALVSLEAHMYPALACDLGAGGALLLSGGLDASACLWDVQTGYLLRSLAVPGAESGGDAGGGGVRAARLSPHRPPLILLATDDGLAPVWSLADADPNPLFIYGGHAEAATCGAWTSDGRALATGGCGGELVLRAPPPAPSTLHHEPNAHELGVQSCDFAKNGSVPGMPEREGTYLLASAGADSLVKLWLIEIDEEAGTASMVVTRSVRAHGGGASCVRWGGGALLASAGGDSWARVWRAADGGQELHAVAAVPAGDAGGTPAVALIQPEGESSELVAVGTLRGELALWRLPARAHAPDDDADPPRFWDEAGVVRWLREYVTRAPGVSATAEQAVEAEERARAARLTGARLLDAPQADLLLAVFGCDIEDEEVEDEKPTEETLIRRALRARFTDELEWLRRPPPSPSLASIAPHALLCPLSHRLVEEPARAADGFTYSRRALRERLAADAPAAPAASPLSGRRLRNKRLHPNHGLREQLRAFLREHDVEE